MRINFLDWLRIFSFMSVFLGHCFISSDIINIAKDPEIHNVIKIIVHFLLNFAVFGGAGVVVFFLISGYIITHVLQHESTFHFLIKRFFRIYPLYVIAVILQYILMPNENTEFLWKTFLIQISLLGDFFNTPSSLSGVEWTLRVELLFYIFMALLKTVYPTFLKNGKIIFLYLLIIFTFSIFSPFPDFQGTVKNAFFLYAPFLFMGSVFYFFEKKNINLNVFLIFIMFLFCLYYNEMNIYYPSFLEYNFAFWGFSIFLIFWIFRNKIKSDKLIYILSSISYSVYLFHKWLYVWLIIQFNSKIISLFLLFIICYIFHIILEKPAIAFSKLLILKLNSKQYLLKNIYTQVFFKKKN